MADNRTSCPANWMLHEEPVRGCGRKSTDDWYVCESVLIPVAMNYSIVCGRIYAYQRGLSAAFFYSVHDSPIAIGVNATIDSPYVSGLSLTHGLIGQRKHVWTFAGATDETHTGYYATTDNYVNNNSIISPFSCPCTNPGISNADKTMEDY